MPCSVDASVGSLSMSGVPGTDNSPTTLVTSNVEVGVVKDAPLVEFQLEMNPLLRPELDVMVKAALRPIQITYDFVSGLYHSTAACDGNALTLEFMYDCVCVCVYTGNSQWTH